MPDSAELLAAYDAQLRAHVSDRLPRGVIVERNEPLLRFLDLGGRGFVLYRDLGGIGGADLDALIARQVEMFAARRERFESSCTDTTALPTCPSDCVRQASSPKRRRRS